jgi:hypothetical protein
MSEDNNLDIVRLFSRKTFSATVIVDKSKGVQIVGGTPIQTPSQTPIHSSGPSPAGSRSRANSYDLECYKALAKEYESSGTIDFGNMNGNMKESIKDSKHI